MTYKQLLNKHKVLRQLSLIQFVAYFGAWFSHVAIYSMLVSFEASPFLISAVVAMNFLPSIVLSPFSGSLVDRLPLKKLMIVLLSIELFMTILFMTISSIDHIIFLMIILFIRMGSASIFFTTEMSLLPKLLSGDELVKANEIHSIIWSFTFTAGMALGGVVVYYFGTKLAFIADACFFILALIVLIKTKFNVSLNNSSQHIFLDIKDGFIYLKNNTKLMHMIFLHATIGLTAFDSLVTLLADYHYKYILAVPLSIGVTNAVRAFALMIGPLFITNWVNKDNLFYLFIIQGLSIFVWAVLQSNFYVSLLGIFMTGLVTTTLWSYTYAMLQKEVDVKYIGRVLSYNEMVFMLSNVLTTMFIGTAAAYVGLEYITSVIALAFIFVAFYYKRVFL